MYGMDLIEKVKLIGEILSIVNFISYLQILIYKIKIKLVSMMITDKMYVKFINSFFELI